MTTAEHIAGAIVAHFNGATRDESIARLREAMLSLAPEGVDRSAWLFHELAQAGRRFRNSLPARLFDTGGQ